MVTLDELIERLHPEVVDWGFTIQGNSGKLRITIYRNQQIVYESDGNISYYTAKTWARQEIERRKTIEAGGGHGFD